MHPVPLNLDFGNIFWDDGKFNNIHVQQKEDRILQWTKLYLICLLAITNVIFK